MGTCTAHLSSERSDNSLDSPAGCSGSGRSCGSRNGPGMGGTCHRSSSSSERMSRMPWHRSGRTNTMDRSYPALRPGTGSSRDCLARCCSCQPCSRCSCCLRHPMSCQRGSPSRSPTPCHSSARNRRVGRQRSMPRVPSNRRDRGCTMWRRP